MGVGLVPELDYGAVAERVHVGVVVGDHGENDLDILFMVDGEVRFSHVCRLGGGTVARIAPRLQIGSGHTVVAREPLTIVASLLCSECGLHGFVTDGRWVSV